MITIIFKLSAKSVNVEEGNKKPKRKKKGSNKKPWGVVTVTKKVKVSSTVSLAEAIETTKDKIVRKEQEMSHFSVLL